MNLKWANGDPSYARENFCYDLFERAGVWTASKATYARVWVHVEGDSAPAYYGVYTMIEPYDNKYLDRRKTQFVNTDGNLWKCSYTSRGPADLRSENADMGEDDNVHEYTYELKESAAGFPDAKSQLQDFIRKVNNLGDSEFKAWMEEKFDVPLFLRTVAVDVAVGMWDDMWNNGNNYYLYFDSPDRENYKVFVLPYDYDNTLGTSNTYDPAKQNPSEWGGDNVQAYATCHEDSGIQTGVCRGTEASRRPSERPDGLRERHRTHTRDAEEHRGVCGQRHRRGHDSAGRAGIVEQLQVQSALLRQQLLQSEGSHNLEPAIAPCGKCSTPTCRKPRLSSVSCLKPLQSSGFPVCGK